MKKTLLFIAILLMINTISNAQAWDGKGDTKINISYEIYSTNLLNTYGNIGDGISASIDYGITENISIGTGIVYNPQYTNFYFNIRSDYHFQNLLELSSNFDIYAGADIGLNTYEQSWDFEQKWGLGLHIGTRFMFTDAIGLYLEFGNRGNAGLSYNF